MKVFLQNSIKKQSKLTYVSELKGACGHKTTI